MKAYLLAAGLGSRLGKLTEKTPKCLIPIAGRPLIEYWFDLFEKYGVDEALINTHHLAEKIESYLKKNRREKVKTVCAREKRLLGSGGAIKANRRFVAAEESFLICYADNLTTVNLDEMRSRHDQHDKALTLGVFETERPRDCGIAQIDDRGVVTSFEEKPERPKGHLAAAGIYMARQKLFGYFPDAEAFDLSSDVFTKMAGDMSAYPVTGYFLDIGTPDNYTKANEDMKRC